MKQREIAGTAFIGLSLPYDYLCGAISTANSRSFSESFGPAAAAMELFRRHGVRAIEIRHFPEAVPAQLIVEGCRNILRAGLEVTLHPATPSSTSASHLADLFPWIGNVLQQLAGHRQGLLLTMHGYTQRHGDEEQLRNRTKALFTYLDDLVERESAPVTFALELSPERFSSEGPVGPSFLASISLLKNTLSNIKKDN